MMLASLSALEVWRISGMVVTESRACVNGRETKFCNEWKKSRVVPETLTEAKRVQKAIRLDGE